VNGSIRRSAVVLGVLPGIVFAATASAAPAQVLPNPPSSVYSYDGSGNNSSHLTWGAAGTALLRRSPAAYGDRISTPAGSSRPSARAISNALSAQSESIVNSRSLSDFIYVWGQFLDHDINLTSTGSEKFPIQVPTGDVSFDPNSTGTQTIPFTRSVAAAGTGTSRANPRQQTDSVTAFIDGSQVYGSDSTRAAALRSFEGGQLRTSAGNMLPFNTDGLANANDAHRLPDDQLFLAGDVRANENPDLTSLQTLFMREHNRIAAENQQAHPDWTDEQLYQSARSVVIAEIQSITYNEFLPALMGRNSLAPYSGYNPRVNPSMSNEFSTAAFRFGHSLLDGEIGRLNDDGSEVPEGSLTLMNSFFNPSVFDPTLPNHEGDVDPFLKAISSGNAQEIDLNLVDDVRNFLFGAPGQGGLDLASLNIQRGRDHGLANYNAVRVAYGLPRVTRFDQITPDRSVQRSLKKLYGSVNNIDLWVGGLAEKHVAQSSLGPLFQRILVDQFTRLRAGDSGWFEHTLSGQQIAEVRATHLSDIIMRNTSLTNIQPNIFVWRGSTS
jgi:peroxidase